MKAERPRAWSRAKLYAVLFSILVGIVLLCLYVLANQRRQPEIVRLGSSVDGRPIELVSFGQSDDRVLVVGGIHGDEYGAAVAHELVVSVRSDPDRLPPDRRLDVIETLNPDGRARNTRGNARNVDINRNMPSRNWAAQLDSQDFSSQKGCTGGTSAGSEPETQAFLRALKARYRLVVMLHSSGGIVDFDGPGGSAVAERIAKRIDLPVQHLSYQPYVRGSVGLYVPEAYGIPVITLELTGANLSPELRDALVSLGEPATI